jgi:hypothetical protein
MTRIILKGVKKVDDVRRNFTIASFDASVLLQSKGGVFITITDQKLSEDLLNWFFKRGVPK